MRVEDLYETFKARMPEEYAALAVQALREDFGGGLEHIPAPVDESVTVRLERNAKIIALKAAGESVETLAERFGLEKSTVYKIIRSGAGAN